MSRLWVGDFLASLLAATHCSVRFAPCVCAAGECGNVTERNCNDGGVEAFDTPLVVDTLRECYEGGSSYETCLSNYDLHCSTCKTWLTKMHLNPIGTCCLQFARPSTYCPLTRPQLAQPAGLFCPVQLFCTQQAESSTPKTVRWWWKVADFRTRERTLQARSS